MDLGKTAQKKKGDLCRYNIDVGNYLQQELLFQLSISYVATTCEFL